VHQEKRGTFEKNGYGYQGSGKHMKMGCKLQGKGHTSS
jgi:hypothetical protein